MFEPLPFSMIALYFLYGLSLFVMGLTIALESAMTRSVRLVSGLWLLAGFGMLHGLAEWLELIAKLQASDAPAGGLDYLALFKAFAMSISFVCLAQFGVSSLVRRRRNVKAIRALRVSSFSVWSLTIATFATLGLLGATDRFTQFEVVVRYGFGLFGGLLASYALFGQSRCFREAGRPGLSRGLYWSSILLAIYAVAEGMSAPESGLWPASQLNDRVVEELIGFPFEIIHGLLALPIAILMTKTFVIESRRALESAHEFMATLNESMKAITSSLNLDAVLNLIIQHAVKASGADGGMLVLLESNNQELLERARYGDSKLGTLASIHPTCQYLFTRVRELGTAVTVDGRRKSRRLPPNVGSDRIAYLCAPINMAEKTIGAIVLAREESNQPFTDETAQLVTALAAEAAIAIENARLYEYTWEMAITDALTGLRNYRYLHDRLRDEVARAIRYKHPFSVIAADCDSLKEVNDRYGHQQGDRLLRCVADKLRESVRVSDIVTRQAGDEFVVLMPETTDFDAAKIAERMRRAVGEIQVDAEGTRIGTTMSFGVATFPDHAADAEELLRRADEAMYRAKASGKNSTRVWEASIEH